MNQTMPKQQARVTRSLPDMIVESVMVNPEGKADRIGGRVPTELLNLEWVQFRNLTERTLLLIGLEVQHMSYRDDDAGTLTRIFQLQGQLPPNSFLRIHSGRGKPKVESKKKIYHAYLNPGNGSYLYQITRDDTIAVVDSQGNVIDRASYSVPVGEGVVLKRVPPVTNQRLGRVER